MSHGSVVWAWAGASLWLWKAHNTSLADSEAVSLELLQLKVA